MSELSRAQRDAVRPRPPDPPGKTGRPARPGATRAGPPPAPPLTSGPPPPNPRPPRPPRAGAWRRRPYRVLTAVPGVVSLHAAVNFHVRLGVPMEADDLALVERARAGESEAFRTLVIRHQRRVYAVALGIV